MTKNNLQIWTVYDHPLDYPLFYVARRFDGLVETNDIMTNTNLEVIRCDLSSMGLVHLMRSDSDDPKIIECWF